MTSNQEQLSRILPSHYQKLADLPDEICQQLIPLASCVDGCGFNAIQSQVKLQKLLTMTETEIIEAFVEFKATI